MDFETWFRFLGKSQDDPAFKAALATAGIKKNPKLDDDDTSVQIELKGHGLELILTDEAFLKELKDQDLGEGPLIMSGVLAKLGKSHGRDLYAGKLPFGIAADMSQEAVRKILGRPDSTGDRFLVDIWKRDKTEIVARYPKDGKSLSALAVMLPNAE